MPNWQLSAPLRATAIAGAASVAGSLQFGVALTTATLSGPTAGTVGVASTYTVTLNAPADQTHVITPSCPGATVSPGTVNITAGNSSATFTVTAASAASYTVDFTISPTLTRAGRPVTLVVSAAPAVTTATLTSTATSGTYPFTFGVAFKKGDIPSSFVTDLPNYQVRVLRTWNDGSAKHAVVSGRVALVQNVAKTVNFYVGTPPTGTNLTSASIQTAAPSASVQCGGLGTVNLSSLLASPVRTFSSGPEMVECHYRGDVGTGDLSAWFHVRLFADGRMWVRAIVENGYLDNGSGALANTGTQTYVPTITIGGITVYNNGGASLSHYGNTRYMAEGWIGGDPAITPLVDATYLRSTKLVPPMASAPNSTFLNALTQTYTPMGRGAISQAMGSTGYQQQIGLLPLWDAAFVASGDARAFRSVLANSSSLNSYGIVWRAKSTNLPVRPTDFPTWTLLGIGAGGDNHIVRGSLDWESAHHPGEGYLAYLLTGDYWHYETMALQAAACYVATPSARGSGTSRFLTHLQTRSVAWMMRSVGQYAALAPDADMVAGTPATDFRTLLGNMYSNLAARITGGESMIYTGNLYQPEYSTPGNWGTEGAIAPWQTDFLVATHGYLWDMEPLTTTTNHQSVRDWQYKWPIGRLGQSGVSADYSFHKAAQYGLEVATPPGNNNNWFSTWGLIYQAETGSANTTSTNTLVDGNIGSNGGLDSYWGNLIPAIVYAVDHAATGAAAAYLRLTGATNWSTLTANFASFPQWGVTPRNPPSALPSWLASEPTFKWVQVPNSQLSTAGVAPSPTPAGNTGPTSVVDKWGGATVRQSSGHWINHGGGHTDYAGNEIYAIQLTANSPTWSRVWGPTPAASVNTTSDYYDDGNPAAQHTYYYNQWDATGDRLLRMVGGTYIVSGLHSPCSSWVWGAANWQAAGTIASIVTAGSLTEGGCCMDPATGDVYQRDGTRARKWQRSTNSWVYAANSANVYVGYNAMAYDGTRGCVWSIGDSTGNAPGGFVQKWTLSGNTFSNVAVTGSAATAATNADAMGITTDPVTGLIYLWNEAGNVYVFDPAALTINTVSMTGTAPGTNSSYGNAQGVFGRFHYVEDLDAIVAQPAWAGPMFAFRLR